FSAPDEHARPLPRDPRAKPRRMTLLCLALALGWVAPGVLVGAEDGGELGWRLGLFAVLVVLSLWTAGTHARQWRAAATRLTPGEGRGRTGFGVPGCMHALAP